MARSNVKVDVSQVEGFARRLALAAEIVEREAEPFQEEWGGKWVDEMQAIVPVLTSNLRDSIEQVEPGGIRIGAPYWRFVDRGTSRAAPQPFVRPAMKRIRTPARDDAGDRAMRLIHGGNSWS